MEEKILEILNRYGNDLYIGDAIPSEKLENAIMNYPVDRSDKVLALIDTTTFGSAKNGMAITVKGIYFKNDWTTKTVKNFLTWTELSKNNVQKGSMFCVLVANQCEFNVSGADINRDVLINLLNEISILFDIANDKISEDKDSYNHLIPELIALCIVSDGEVEDSEIEMANEIIVNDDLIKDKEWGIEELGNKIDEFLTLKNKSETIFKLKIISISSKVSNIKDILEKEKILVILDGMLESVHADNHKSTKLIIDKIREKI